MIVGASGYLAPFRQIFCLDWFLLWASERLICQMHKALHICPVSPTHKVNASLFISHFAFFLFFFFLFLSLPSIFCSISSLHFRSPLFVSMHSFYYLWQLCGVESKIFPFVFIITQRALLAQHQDCHQLLLFHFLPVFLLFLFFLLLNDKYLCHFLPPPPDRIVCFMNRGTATTH